MAMEYTASSVYGTLDSLQPNNVAAPTHAGQPEPFAVTQAPASGFTSRNPVIVLLVILAVALWLIHFSVGIDFSFGASKK